jgi:hypothetical protein
MKLFDLFMNGVWFDGCTKPSATAAVCHWGGYVGHDAEGTDGTTPHGVAWSVVQREVRGGTTEART